MQTQQYIKLLLNLLLGLVLWFLPHPVEISAQAWHLFAIFITTIIAIITNPMPMPAIALLSVTVAVLTDTLKLNQALSGFSHHIVWLVVFAFFISRGFSKTNLGRRIAYYFISKLGGSTLGLSYGLLFTEFLLSPLIPSVTARAGGVIFPIAKSLIEEYGRETGAKGGRVGAFIMKVSFQASVITSTMFLTAMAANPLVVKIAADNGIAVSWTNWAVAAIVPGIISLLILPLLLFILYTPDIKSSESAPRMAKAELEKMGSMSKHEIIMLLVFALLIFLWIVGETYGISATTTALLGFVILLVSGVLTMDDAIEEKGAWSTFIWYAVLVMMAGALADMGLISWLGQRLDLMVEGISVLYVLTAGILFFFFIHYFFASATVLLSTLYATLLLLFINTGIPAFVSVFSLAFAGILSSGLTHFGSSAAPLFYGSGYVTTKTWWVLGFAIGVTNLVIWVLAGGFWWKFLGWY